MGQGPISLVPVDVGIVHIHGSPVDVGIVHIHESPFNVGTVHIYRSPVNVGTVHVYGSMQIKVQIPQKSDDLVMPPWML